MNANGNVVASKARKCRYYQYSRCHDCLVDDRVGVVDVASKAVGYLWCNLSKGEIDILLKYKRYYSDIMY
jgi:hypothetical protein